MAWLTGIERSNAAHDDRKTSTRTFRSDDCRTPFRGEGARDGMARLPRQHPGLSFTARCRTKRTISPLLVGDEVDVIGMGPADECAHEIFVFMRWEHAGLAVPLAQLAVTDGDAQTWQAVEDWLYWVDRGYRF